VLPPSQMVFFELNYAIKVINILSGFWQEFVETAPSCQLFVANIVRSFFELPNSQTVLMEAAEKPASSSS